MLKKHSVCLMDSKTSVTVEDEFWEVLAHIAMTKNVSINDLVTDIDLERSVNSPNLSSGIRVYILQHLRRAAGV